MFNSNSTLPSLKSALNTAAALMLLLVGSETVWSQINGQALTYKRFIGLPFPTSSWYHPVTQDISSGTPDDTDGWQKYNLRYEPTAFSKLTFQVLIDGDDAMNYPQGDPNWTFEIYALDASGKVVGIADLYENQLSGVTTCDIKIWEDQLDFQSGIFASWIGVDPAQYFGTLAPGDPFQLLLHWVTDETNVNIYEQQSSGNYNFEWQNTNGDVVFGYYYPMDGGLLPSNQDYVNFSSAVYVPECGNPEACNYEYLGDVNHEECIVITEESTRDCDGVCFNDSDGDGVCDEDEVDACMDADACNYALDSLVVVEGDTLMWFNGTQEANIEACLFLDVVGVCGGDCIADVDSDGICDDNDTCVGYIDACGECQSSTQNEAPEGCGCGQTVAEGDCDCNGNQLDALGDCGGDCLTDEDSDGICDDNGEDPCVGEVDECGICNGPGAIPGCGCDDIPEGFCDCAGTKPLYGRDCSGGCLSDVNNNGICDVDEGMTFGVEVPHDENASKTFDYVRPLALRATLDSLKHLHHSMADHLEYGSTTRHARVVAAEDSLKSHGELLVQGKGRFEKNVQVYGSAMFDQDVLVNKGMVVNNDSAPVATFVGQQEGLVIQLGQPGEVANGSHRFVEFQDSQGQTVGRIQGQTANELLADDGYELEILAYDLDIAGTALNLTNATLSAVLGGSNVVVATGDLTAASTSVTPCVGFGACVTTPIVSFISANAAKLLVKIANLSMTITEFASAAVDAGAAISNKVLYSNYMLARVGVTYESGSADYAEWLPKANREDDFAPGEVVGIKDGKISRNTKDADHLFVISTKPIVLGNQQPNGDEGYAMAAFLGQVPTRIAGAVNSGDFILASGFNDGFAIARSPDQLDVADLPRLVGVSWQSGNDPLLNFINVAVGLETQAKAVAQLLQNGAVQGPAGGTNSAPPGGEIQGLIDEGLVFIGELPWFDEEDSYFTMGDQPLTFSDVHELNMTRIRAALEPFMTPELAKTLDKMEFNPEMEELAVSTLRNVINSHNEWVYETLKERNVYIDEGMIREWEEMSPAFRSKPARTH